MQTSPASPQLQSETAELPKITATRAREICRAFELSEPGQRLLDDAITPLQFVSRLIEIECFADAVSFLAHALPKREAVWWGCLCARDALAAQVSPAAMTALTAAEAWVYKPTEETRHAAGAAAGAADTGSPCTWPAFAAFWAGDDIAPRGHVRQGRHSCCGFGRDKARPRNCGGKFPALSCPGNRHCRRRKRAAPW